MTTPSRLVRTLALLLAFSGVATGAAAQRPSSPPDLGQATLEDLMKIEITSASRKEQRADEVPAAVFVITQDDIRQSGLRTLPELLRLVPGVQVAQLTATNYAVSIRGFNDEFSNKLLVLVDGRSIYKRTFTGVFWDEEDLVLADIDRIEVIRGPGAAVWGANAVNGVINIVTKSAKDTQGALFRASAGTFDRGQALARYGGSFANGAYRVYSKWTDQGNTSTNPTTLGDNFRVFTSGARADWTRGRDDWMVDGRFSTGDAHTMWKLPIDLQPNLAPQTDVTSSFHVADAVGRWTRHLADGSSLQVQSSVSIDRRDDLVSLDSNTLDADVQYQRKVGRRQDIVAGGGYRFEHSGTGSRFSVTFDPAALNTVVANTFIQDEVALAPRLRLTLGSKVEHDTLSGWGVEPSARLMWQPAPRHQIWVSAARALRTPSLSDLALRFNALVVPSENGLIVGGAIGNPAYKPEVFRDVEAGYRLQVGTLASIDVTAFRGHYSGLPTSEPLAPVFETTPAPHLFIGTEFQNLLQADTTGAEIAAHLSPLRVWRIDASYSAFHLTPHVDPTSLDPKAGLFDGSAPAQQWQVRSSVTVGPRAEVDGTIFHTGALPSLFVPAYTRADLRVELKLTPRVSAVVLGTNLFDSTHPEFTSAVVAATPVPRSAGLQLVWRY